MSFLSVFVSFPQSKYIQIFIWSFLEHLITFKYLFGKFQKIQVYQNLCSAQFYDIVSSLNRQGVLLCVPNFFFFNTVADFKNPRNVSIMYGQEVWGKEHANVSTLAAQDSRFLKVSVVAIRLDLALRKQRQISSKRHLPPKGRWPSPHSC